MSLGGYKFAGKYCEKGSLTDAQWALRMHKTKVAAFMAANALADAGWDYDMTGSPDGNYHCLDSVGNNYVTVFKRQNGENDYTWFALYTLTYATKTGTDSGAAKRSLIYKALKKDVSTSWYVGTWACSFFRIGESQIAYNDSLVSLTDTQNGTTPLIPMGNQGTATNYTDDGYFGKYSSMFSLSTNYYGFAVKGSDVIIFQGNSYSSNALCCTVASGKAFPDLNSHGVIAINTQDGGLGPDYDESANRVRPSTTFSMPLTLCQDDTGNAVVPAPFNVLCEAMWTSAVNAYPFQSITFYAIQTNSSGVYNKGTVNIELVACNMNTISSNVPANYSISANGNYLRVASQTSDKVVGSLNDANLNSLKWYPMLYVGWDPSNPDITQASSWSLYDET